MEIKIAIDERILFPASVGADEGRKAVNERIGNLVITFFQACPHTQIRAFAMISQMVNTEMLRMEAEGRVHYPKGTIAGNVCTKMHKMRLTEIPIRSDEILVEIVGIDSVPDDPDMVVEDAEDLEVSNEQ